MKRAYVNGEAIAREAVQFEFERLVRFYTAHGMKADEVRKNMDKLLERAQEQAIGAKLLLARAAELDLPVSEEAIEKQVAEVEKQMGGHDAFVAALAKQKISVQDFRKELEKGCRVDALVNQACVGAAEPTEEDIAQYFEANQADYPNQTLVDVHDIIRDLLRHAARGVATQALVDDLREKAKIEYK